MSTAETPAEAGNGLSRFSLHATEASSAAVLDRLAADRAEAPGLRPEGTDTPAAVDPETAARRILDQALASPAVPSLTAPVANGVASEFTTIGTETVPLTGTTTVKFRQSVAGIPVYGSLVTVELDENNELVGLDSAVGQPDGVDPVATVAPAAALTAAAEAPDGYTPDLAGAVPRLRWYYDRAGARWRLVYLLEHVPVTVDRDHESADDRDSGLEPPRFVDYVIDAHDGDVVSLIPRTPSMAGPVEDQTAVDSFGASRTFSAERDGDRLVLRDAAHNVETYDFGFGDPAACPATPSPSRPTGRPPRSAPTPTRWPCPSSCARC